MNLRLVSRQWNTVAESIFDPSVSPKALENMIRKRNLLAVQKLLDDKRTIISKDALYVACSNQLVDIAKRLVEDPQLVFYGSDRQGLLIVAIRSGNTKLVETLTRDGRLLATKPSESWALSPFVLGCQHGDFEMVKVLRSDPFITKENLKSGLGHAITLSKFEVMRYLITDENCYLEQQHIQTALQAALSKGNEDFVQFMLHTEKCHPKQYPAESLYLFASYGHLEGLNIILQISFQRQSKVLKKACLNGYLDIVKRLSEDELTDFSIPKAFYNACFRSHKDVIEFLLADPRTDLEKALISACKTGMIDVVKQLIEERNIDPCIENNKPIISASIFGHVEVVQYLLEIDRVDPGVEDSFAFTRAMRNGYYEVAMVLLESNKIDPSQHNNIAIKIACERGKVEMFNRLMQDERVDPSMDNNFCILNTRNEEILSRLLLDERIDPTAKDNHVWKYSVGYCSLILIEQLLRDKRIDPTCGDNFAIKYAASLKRRDVVHRPVSYTHLTLPTT
eukprot:TRINITY_DN5038_c0_g1_i1.p1 TRINITY_DN5038_c0_g1~~TRINITY_DN5038_c0_g1_i1.p1  ORF type:complete len:531 (+),score=117.23 TRINITY_DN5038_c0_g1_i1:71-1594(+)